MLYKQGGKPERKAFIMRRMADGRWLGEYASEWEVRKTDDAMADQIHAWTEDGSIKFD